ncbi:MAG: kinesin-like protein Klp8 [Peltula sp. TS41687]|nr:MAG: kinesin-like protein Klp8 [Peltula sp. TS41687]
MAPAGGGNIKVVVRVRPLSARELGRGAKCVVQMKDAQTILTPPLEGDERLRSGSKSARAEGKRVFAFDKSYWSVSPKDPHFAGQENLFADLGRPLLDNAFKGYNNCIFAYGQTGSGKSYSMMGYRKEAGVIPRICQDMFERITELQKDTTVRCTVEVSYLEIYNERVRDLLNPSTKGNLKVREHPSTGPYVEDLAKLVVRSFQEIDNLMDEGNKARTVAATNMNETSSRSHAVFTLTLTQRRHDVETNLDTEKVAKISLVDLAGSERATSTGATGARLKEGAEINRSLSTLGRVIAALADLSSGKKRNMSMVPYRDSVLTWLLKDSLGGNSMTAMIAAISPADINYEETLSTLRYADSAKRIKNHAVINEDPNARMIRELKEELAQLRSKLDGEGGVGGSSHETYAADTPLEKQMVSIVATDGTVKKVSKAEIAEQLNQSEKLYRDLNQTWEEKLQKTEQIQQEREAALEELGISIEKGFVGLHTPKRMPHLVNLSDDPLLAECLVYNLKPGTTTVGNLETTTHSEIRLNGKKILQQHCTFENGEGIVTIVPKDGAAVMVNGIRIENAKRLRSGYRIILGDFHIFRFNHPEEARAELAEHSLLRRSVTTGPYESPGPRLTNGMAHARTESKADTSYMVSEGERPDSPAPNHKSSRDSDWAFARREAAHAILGPDQKISHLTDDELDVLFEEVHRVRAVRKARPESRLDFEEDVDSVTSFPVREKYTSIGTSDNLSLDTAITLPSTPQPNEADERWRIAQEDIANGLNKQPENNQEQPNTPDAANADIDEIHAVKDRLEEALRTANEEGQDKFDQQGRASETQVEAMGSSQKRTSDYSTRLSGEGLALVHWVLEHWRRQKYVRMAESILQHAGMLKEAQVMSHEMDKNVFFQSAIVGTGHTFESSYDLVLNGISGEGDEALETAAKPCAGVRVLDLKNSVVYLWSFEKLQRRMRLMRQMHQYMDRPEYLQHLNLANPFSESFVPQYSLIGDADVPLSAVFELRVQDFSLDVMSPYTFGVVGIIKLSLEPSAAQAPPSTLKFNVVMHDLVGFPEREGTDVHAQLFIPGLSEDDGATTTQIIRGFDEGPVRFESVHSMSLPQKCLPSSALRVSVFARVTRMHMDKLMSWDEMKESPRHSRETKKMRPRLSEAEFHSREHHDIFARLQISELLESGEYLPVEVMQTNALDMGAYQLHQGLQRRIAVSLTYNAVETMQRKEITSLRVGNIRLVDPSGKVLDVSSSAPEVPLRLISEPAVKHNADGTSNATIVAQWDSSLHGSPLLDRITVSKYRVRMSLSWNITSERLAEPALFFFDLDCQILPRMYVRPSSRFLQLWGGTRIAHATVALFSLTVRPTSARRAVDLWRLNTQDEYVKGQERLIGWSPRGVSLVRDFIRARRRRRRVMEVETLRGVLNPRALNVKDGLSTSKTSEDADRRQYLLSKCVNLWTSSKDIGTFMFPQGNTEPSLHETPFNADSTKAEPPRMMAEVQHVMKNSSILKTGYLLAPDDTNTRWTRRYVELRRPYLHLHAVPAGDEVNVINLTHSRIDHQPHFERLLRRPNIFAIYAPQNTYFFAARTEREKVEWILRIDQSYFASSSSNSSAAGEDG